MRLSFGGENLPAGHGKEYKEKDYSGKEAAEHDPYSNPLEGAVNVPGSDVVDPENYYNEPGFEDKEIYNDVVNNSQPEGEIGALLEKYGLEEWELVEWMKKCEDYENGKKAGAPFKDMSKVRELAGVYRDYLAAKNEHGLPFSNEELKNVPIFKLEELSDLYKEQVYYTMKIAELNGADDKPAETGVVYSTGEKKSGPGVRARYVGELKEARGKIVEIEGKILNQKPKTPENKDKNAWKEVPEYSPEELALHLKCLEYFRNRKNTPPTFADGKPLTEAQILDVVQEVAADEKWPNGRFFEETFKGRRQLSYVEKSGQNRVKYVFLSQNLPAGKYFFEANPDQFFVSRNNPNSAIAPIRLMVSGANPKKFMAEKEDNKQKLKASA